MVLFNCGGASQERQSRLDSKTTDGEVQAPQKSPASKELTDEEIQAGLEDYKRLPADQRNVKNDVSEISQQALPAKGSDQGSVGNKLNYNGSDAVNGMDFYKLYTDLNFAQGRRCDPERHLPVHIYDQNQTAACVAREMSYDFIERFYANRCAPLQAKYAVFGEILNKERTRVGLEKAYLDCVDPTRWGQFYGWGYCIANIAYFYSSTLDNSGCR